MRDLALLRFTLQAIRDLGQGIARLQQVSRSHRAWYAGPQPLNGQALQDLLDDGWLRKSGDGRMMQIDVWPGFATSTGVCHNG